MIRPGKSRATAKAAHREEVGLGNPISSKKLILRRYSTCSLVEAWGTNSNNITQGGKVRGAINQTTGGNNNPMTSHPLPYFASLVLS